MSEGKKTCAQCGKVRPLLGYFVDKRKSDGRRSECKACTAEYRAKHKERSAKTERDWRERNRERCARAKAEWKKRNPDLYRALIAKYYKADRERRLEYHKTTRELLKPSYVANTLGLKTNNVPSELLDLKREQLTLHRLAKQLKQASTNAKDQK